MNNIKDLQFTDLKGTKKDLDARKLIRLVSVMGHAKAHWELIEELKCEDKALYMNEVWAHTVEQGWTTWFNGRYKLTEKGEEIASTYFAIRPHVS